MSLLELFEQIMVWCNKPTGQVNEIELNKLIAQYRQQVEVAPLRDIMPVFEKLKIGSTDDEWFNAPYEIGVLTYKNLFARLKISELLAEFGLFVSLFNDPEENLSKEINKVADFLKCEWLDRYMMPPPTNEIH